MSTLLPSLGFPCSLSCDKCQRAWLYTRHAHRGDCLNYAISVGWTVIDTSGGQRHYCPRCTRNDKGET